MIAVGQPGALSRHLDRVLRMMQKEKGPKFDDSYSLGKLIAKGSHGSVYRAYDLADPKKRLAVKVIDRKNRNKEEEEQVLTEVAIMQNLADLENTNKVLNFFISSKYYYIVQTLAIGGDVGRWLVKNGCYDERNARLVAVQLLQTVQEFHSRGFMHRDLKPGNILLPDKTNTSIKVADWGYAIRFDPMNLPTKKFGTLGFAAPEVMAGKPYDQAVDLWSVGCILYMMLLGRPAFHSKDTDELYRKISEGDCQFHEMRWKGISPQAIECIMGLLTVNPKARWTPARALASTWLSDCCQCGNSLLQ